jgi:hypothetical protein
MWQRRPNMTKYLCDICQLFKFPRVLPVSQQEDVNGGKIFHSGISAQYLLRKRDQP